MLNQDNLSAIKMEKDGRNSCTGNSRHIHHIMYFFIKGRADKKEIDIVYCPTGEMMYLLDIGGGAALTNKEDKNYGRGQPKMKGKNW